MERKAEIIKVGLVNMKVCVPEGLTFAEIEKWANAESPTGIASPWRVDNKQVNVRCKCDEREGCEHLILEC